MGKLKLFLDLDGVTTGDKPHAHSVGDHQFPESADYRKAEGESNCGSCVFFEDGTCEAYDAKSDITMICNSYDASVDDDTPASDLGNGVGMSEFYSTNGSVREDDDLIWKTVLRTGTWRYRPGPGQRPVPTPLSVVRGRSTNPRLVLGMEDILESFQKHAIEHVTIPLSHEDKVDENTGYVKELKIADDPERPDQAVLVAGLKFTDPAIKEKIKSGSIANTSVGLHYDYIRKDDGVKFGTALAHIALTNRPWINGMKPFSLSEADDKDIKTLEFAEDTPKDPVKLDDNKIYCNLDGVKYSVTVVSINENKIELAPQDEWEQQLSEETPQIPNKEKTMSEIKGLEGLELSEETATKVAELLQAKDGELDSLRTRAQELEKQTHVAAVDARIDELKNIGLSEQPGFLAEVRKVLLADNGDTKLELSENGKTETLSLSEIVNSLIDALPKKDGKINFSDQAENVGLTTDDKPNKDAADENKTADEKYAEAYEYLHGTKPNSKK